MDKHIIREIKPDCTNFSEYFDDDGFNEKSGDYCNTLFLVKFNRFWDLDGLNIDEYKRVQEQAETILNGFEDMDNNDKTYYSSYKDVMESNGIPYTSHKCHLLREWAKSADPDKPKSIARLLTITTGKAWKTLDVYGYCQGDFVTAVYCPVQYPDGVRSHAEIWLGCAKEFCVIDLDENGEESDSCYGYYVADCDALQDYEYKDMVCEMAGIKPEETRLELIDGYTTHMVYTYRVS